MHCRRRIAKSTMKMVSNELCAGNLAAAVEFGKLMKYEGPWIAAGDGTKVCSFGSCFHFCFTHVVSSFVQFYPCVPSTRSRNLRTLSDRPSHSIGSSSQLRRSNPESSQKSMLQRQLLLRSGCSLSMSVRLHIIIGSWILTEFRFHFPICLYSPSHSSQTRVE
jgi:hypothetical protein